MTQPVHIGQHIRCNHTDVGKLVRVVLNPNHNQITHLVVELTHSDHSIRLVPLAAITAVDNDSVTLHYTLTELHEQPLFDERFFLLPDQPHPTLGYLPQQYLFAAIEALLAPIGAPTIPTIVHTQHLPSGETAISKATSVVGADGHLGHVEQLEVNPDGSIQQLVVRHGHPLAEHFTSVPVEDITSATPEHIQLRLTRTAFLALPRTTRNS